MCLLIFNTSITVLRLIILYVYIPFQSTVQMPVATIICFRTKGSIIRVLQNVIFLTIINSCQLIIESLFIQTGIQTVDRKGM